MPWKVGKSDECPDGKPHAVIKEDDGSVAGCHETREKADAQVKALYANEDDMGIIRDSQVSDVKDYEMFAEKYPPKEEQEKIKRKGLVRSLTREDSMSTSGNGGGTYTVEFTTDTSALADLAPAEATAGEEVGWEGILAVEGYPTNDGRMLMIGEMGERELPLSLMSQTVTAEGHAGAQLAGRIDEVWRVPNDEYGEGAIEIWGSGVFDNSDVGRETARQVEAGMLRGVSVDTDPTGFAMLDPETLEEVDPESLSMEDALFGGYITGLKGNIMGATLTPFQAIEHATISILSVSKDNVVVASAFPWSVVRREVLTAAAKGLAPMKPSRDWFDQPEADRPTPLTVTSDGRVFGHLAPWGTCHVGMSGVCRMAPRSRSGYAYYHLGQIETSEGDLVSVGKLTVNTDHAPSSPSVSPAAVRAHYDDTGTVGAYVRAKDGVHGIWLSGAIRSDAPATVVRDMRANPPSGDWRSENNGLELQAALCVVVPGFPIPRYEAVLTASGAEEEEVVTLIQSGFMPDPIGEKEGRRRLAALKSRAQRALVG